MNCRGTLISVQRSREGFLVLVDGAPHECFDMAAVIRLADDAIRPARQHDQGLAAWKPTFKRPALYMLN